MYAAVLEGDAHLLSESIGVNSSGQVKTMCVDQLCPTQTVVLHGCTTDRQSKKVREEKDMSIKSIPGITDPQSNRLTQSRCDNGLLHPVIL